MLLGFEVVVIQKYPGPVTQLLCRTMSCGVGFYMASALCTSLLCGLGYGRDDGQKPVLGWRAVVGVVLVILGSGVLTTYIVLRIAPWHTLSEAVKIVPDLRALGTFVLGWCVVLALAAVLIAVLVQEALAMKSGRMDAFDVEEQRESLVKKISVQAFSGAKEILKGIYRAVGGRKRGLEQPPSVVKKNQ